MINRKTLCYLVSGLLASTNFISGCEDDCIKWGSKLKNIYQQKNELNLSSQDKKIIIGKASISESTTASHVTYCCWAELNPEVPYDETNKLGEKLNPSGLESQITIRYNDSEKPNGYGYKYASSNGGHVCLTLWPQSGISLKEVHLGNCSFYVSETPILEGPAWDPVFTGEWAGGYDVASITFNIEPTCLLRESEKTHRQCTYVSPEGTCEEWRWE